MKNKAIETIRAFVAPNLSEQKAALTARHEESKARLAEHRSRRDELAVAGGADFEAACAKHATMQTKVEAEASALQKLDAQIAAAEAAATQAKLDADRKRAADFCTSIAARAEAAHAAHEQWLLSEHASVMNAYRKAIGHDPVDFRAEGPWRMNLNDLRTTAGQMRERASRILAGIADEELGRTLAAIK